MDCPVCQTVKLVMSERQGIEIDYCPNCRGVWLDRGELDKIIEKSSGAVVQPVVQRNEQHGSPLRQPDGFGRSHQTQSYPEHQQGHYKKKKKEGFLSELFDF